MSEIMDYDPNLVYCGRMAKQTVRLTFGQWKYRKTIELEVGGNCTGFDVIDAAVGSAYTQLEQRGIYGSDETYAVIFLDSQDGSGDQLEVQDDEDEYEDWLKKMLISAEIISIRPDKR
ncbi:DUF5406 family protein [Pseudomonas luteola]|uniref:DUF5406 family protein n=1 Tax=Pseudomonas luteola TaxID=47886 RepID=A0ABS0MXK5_PSELU|nr:DUF5406 family protein [Pseudomonas luteola]MBH3440482.1 DUF5406 family protein [Pseudomonas luteola]